MDNVLLMLVFFLLKRILYGVFFGGGGTMIERLALVTASCRGGFPPTHQQLAVRLLGIPTLCVNVSVSGCLSLWFSGHQFDPLTQSHLWLAPAPHNPTRIDGWRTRCSAESQTRSQWFRLLFMDGISTCIHWEESLRFEHLRIASLLFAWLHFVCLNSLRPQTGAGAVCSSAWGGRDESEARRWCCAPRQLEVSCFPK